MRLGLLLMSLSLWACNGDDKDPPDDTDTTDDTDVTDDTDPMDDTDMGDDTDPPPTDDEIAASLWTEIAGYDAWGQPTGWDGIVYQNAESPHGPYLAIYMNTVAADAWASVLAGGEFPDGAIFVKHLYDTSDPTSSKGVTFAMKRDADYGTSGWFWAQYDDTGAADPKGDVGMCSGCHSGYSGDVGSADLAPGTPPT